jgi:uncharacterized phage-like protein YoqJ
MIGGATMAEGKVCCFTGHRPCMLPWGEDESEARCLRLKALLAQEIERAWQEGFRQFWCGMARGADLYYAEAVLACQSVHPEVELLAAVPCPNQTRGWPEPEVERYWHILHWIGGDRCTLVSPAWTKQCMHLRNEYMVDRSSRLIAVYDGESAGGTRYTLQYAMKKGLECIVIDPADLTILR